MSNTSRGNIPDKFKDHYSKNLMDDPVDFVFGDRIITIDRSTAGNREITSNKALKQEIDQWKKNAAQGNLNADGGGAAREAKEVRVSTQSKPEYDLLLKVTVIGDSQVGKSCLILKFTDHTYTENFYGNIGGFKIRTVELDNKIIKLQVWDDPQKPNERGAHVILFTYDVTNSNSFESIKQHLQEADKCAAEDTVKILVGTKCDLNAKKAVDFETADKFAYDNQLAGFMETSAKTDINIEKVFLFAAQKMMKPVCQKVAKSAAAASDNDEDWEEVVDKGKSEVYEHLMDRTAFNKHRAGRRFNFLADNYEEIQYNYLKKIRLLPEKLNKKDILKLFAKMNKPEEFIGWATQQKHNAAAVKLSQPQPPGGASVGGGGS